MRIFLSLFLFIALSFVWNACSKEDIEVPANFPVHFIAERWERTGTFRLFTAGREIMDRRTIDGYLARHPYLDTLHTKLDSLPGFLFIHLLSENNAVFDDNNNTTEQVFDLERKGNRFLFTANKSTPLPQPVLRPFYAPSAEWLLMKEADSLKANIPVNTFPFQAHWTRVAHGNYKVMKVSLLGFSLQIAADQSDASPILHQNLLFNEFNPDFPKLLGQKDTLLIQEFALIFTRSAD
jgi:hypothetical protein